MTKYRKKITDEEPSVPENPVYPGDFGDMPSYMSLAHQYGLDDDSEMTPGGSDNNKQTTEQEYQAYVTAPCSPGKFNVLNFWEVGGEWGRCWCSDITDKLWVGQPVDVSNSLCHGHGLPSSSSIIRAL